MFEEILSQQNPHWTGARREQGVERSCFARLLDYLSTGQVVAITGVRRSGKSTLVRQLVDHLIDSEETAPANILFLNLEHPHLSPYREESAGLQNIYEDYLKMMQPQGKVYVCLDEVQFFREWPVFVKAHHEMGQVQFVVTGSNAAMLSSDMVTLLSGRSLPLEVYPFSLRELAASKGLDLNNAAMVAKQAAVLRSILEELLKYGGFPIVALGQQKQTAFDVLGAHARTVLLQDVAPRLGVRKPANLERLYVYLVSNIGKPFSYANLSKLFDLSDKSIKEYLQALVDAYLVYETDLFSYSLKKQIRNPKKVYAIDTGQANAMGFKFSADRGRLLENLIFIDLQRLGLDVYYYRTASDREVDFVVQTGTDISLLQVTWSLEDPQTRARELQAQEEAKKELNCDRAAIIVAEGPSKDAILAHRYLSMKPEERKRLIFK